MKLIAEFSASGRKRRPPKKKHVAATRHRERRICIFKCFVRQKCGPARWRANGVTIAICPA